MIFFFLVAHKIPTHCNKQILGNRGQQHSMCTKFTPKNFDDLTDHHKSFSPTTDHLGDTSKYCLVMLIKHAERRNLTYNLATCVSRPEMTSHLPCSFFFRLKKIYNVFPREIIGCLVSSWLETRHRHTHMEIEVNPETGSWNVGRCGSRRPFLTQI